MIQVLLSYPNDTQEEVMLPVVPRAGAFIKLHDLRIVKVEHEVETEDDPVPLLLVRNVDGLPR